MSKSNKAPVVVATTGFVAAAMRPSLADVVRAHVKDLERCARLFSSHGMRGTAAEMRKAGRELTEAINHDIATYFGVPWPASPINRSTTKDHAMNKIKFRPKGSNTVKTVKAKSHPADAKAAIIRAGGVLTGTRQPKAPRARP